MNSNSNPTINAAATLKSLSLSGFPASSMADLYAQLQSAAPTDGDADSFRAIFDEMQAHGDVPHDRSILSPAAYLLDLLRMVKSVESPQTPFHRRLLGRRPDLGQLELDDVQTNTMTPYLRLVNDLLQARIETVTDLRSDKGFDTPETSPLLSSLHVQRAKAYLASTKIDLAEITAIFGSQDEATAARLGLSMSALLTLSDAASHLDSVRPLLPPPLLAEALQDKGLPWLLSLLGCDGETVALACGPDVLGSVLGRWIATAAGGFGEGVAVAFVPVPAADRDAHGTLWSLAMRTPDEAQVRPAYDTTKPEESETALQAASVAISETLRFSRVARALGIGARALDDLARGLGQALMFPDDLRRAAAILDLAKRFDIDTAQATLLMGGNAALTALRADGTPPLYLKLFPLGDAGSAHLFFCIENLEPAKAAAAGLTLIEARQALHFRASREIRAQYRNDPDQLTQSLAEIEGWSSTDGNTTLALFYRLGRLSRLLSRPVTDLLTLAHLLDIGLDEPAEITTLIDSSDWLTKVKLTPAELMALAQDNQVANCIVADVQGLAEKIAAALAKLDDKSESSQVECLHATLADHYKLDAETLPNIFNLGMDPERMNALVAALRDGSLTQIDIKLPLPATPALLGLSDLQSGVAIAHRFPIALNVLAAEHGLQAGSGFDHKLPCGWRNLRNLRAYDRLQCLAKTRKTDVLADFETLSQLYSKHASDAELRPAIARLLDLPEAVLSTLIGNSAQATAVDWLSTISHENDIFQPVVALERAKSIAASLATDLPHLQSLAGLVCFDNQTDSEDVITDTLAALAARSDAAAWLTTVDSLETPLLETERDVTLAHLIWLLNYPDTPDCCWLDAPPKTAEEVSDLLLVDVQMGGASKISPLKLALNSVQRYIQRVLGGNEGSPPPFKLDKTQWTWRSHYRLWEANRQVFLFPENFLDPGLRRQKTPLFRELEDALLQAEISDDAVMLIYKDYFDQLEALSKLEIVAGCVASVLTPGDQTAQNTLFFLGRTPAKKPDYYIRSAVFGANKQLLYWQPWEKVSFPLHSREATLGYVNNRLHLFWLDERAASEQLDGIRTTTTFVTLRYSYKLHGAGWLAPQICEEWDDRPIGHVTRGKTTDKIPSFVSTGGKSFECPFPTHTDNQFPMTIKSLAPSQNQLFNTNAGGPDQSGSRITARLVADLDIGTIALGKKEPEVKSCTSWASECDLNGPFDSATFDGDMLPKNVVALAAGNTNAPSSDPIYYALSWDAERRKSGTWISEDEGKTWRNCMRGEPSQYQMERIYTAAKSKILYIRTTGDGRLYRGDGRIGEFGECGWSQVILPVDDHFLFDLAVSDTGLTLAAVLAPNTQEGETKLTISSDAGASWRTVNLLGRWATSVCFGSDGLLFVATATQQGMKEDVTDIGSDGLPHVVTATQFDPQWRSEHCWLSVQCLDDLSQSWIARGAYSAICGAYFSAMTRDPEGGVVMSLGRQLWRASPSSPLTMLHNDIVMDQVNALGQFAGYGRIVALQHSPYGWLGQMANGDLPNLNYSGWYDLDPHTMHWGAIAVRNFDGTVDTSSTVQALAHVPGAGMLIGTSTRAIRRSIDAARVIARSTNAATAVLSFPWRDPVAFSSTAVHELSQRLITGGLDAMLSLESQTDLIETAADGVSKTAIDFRPSAAFSAYYREVFFHIPYLIADTLNREGKFEEAQRWYHHIFRPQRIGDTHNPADKTPFWRYAPFKSHDLDKLNAYDPEEFALYESDPFDAHAIASIRMGAFEKAVVMRYIDNLIDWGDQLFAQNNWESNTLAMSHYQLAADLLGPDPRQGRRAGVLPEVKTFAELYPIDTTPVSDPSDSFHLEDSKFFPIPQNDGFACYWDNTRAQMAKIRASQDIHGIQGQLALFQPPIDPRQLMAALASGQSLSQAIAETAKGTPIYRFEAMLARARTAAQNVISLSGSLLSTLEKKDAEGLALLRALQERQMLDTTGRARDLVMTEAQARVTAIGTQQATVAARRGHFQALISADLLPSEQLAMTQKALALDLMSTTADIRTASAVGYALPTIFGLADGGENWGKVTESAAAAIDANASAINQGAGLAESRGQNDRRREDWNWQLVEAEAEIARLADDLTAANLAVTRAQLDLDAHQQTVAQAEAMSAYMDGKFTNAELYGWLTGRLTSLVAQSFQLALSLAQDAQWAFQWERGVSTNLITAPPATNLRSSLLAGEELLLNLGRMEKAWLDSGKRQLEIEKTLSLQALKSDSAFTGVCDDWTKLQQGSLSFSLIPELFAADGAEKDAYRRIRSIAVTLPAIVGPYQSINAVLQQVAHTQIRDNKQTKTQSNTRVALSRGVADHGVFELDFKSDHYQPFEGTGAVSDWKLTLPDNLAKQIRASISDVVIHLRYSVTAD